MSALFLLSLYCASLVCLCSGTILSLSNVSQFIGRFRQSGVNLSLHLALDTTLFHRFYPRLSPKAQLFMFLKVFVFKYGLLPCETEKLKLGKSCFSRRNGNVDFWEDMEMIYDNTLPQFQKLISECLIGRWLLLPKHENWRETKAIAKFFHLNSRSTLFNRLVACNMCGFKVKKQVADFVFALMDKDWQADLPCLMGNYWPADLPCLKYHQNISHNYLIFSTIHDYDLEVLMTELLECPKEQLVTLVMEWIESQNIFFKREKIWKAIQKYNLRWPILKDALNREQWKYMEIIFSESLCPSDYHILKLIDPKRYMTVLPPSMALGNNNHRATLCILLDMALVKPGDDCPPLESYIRSILDGHNGLSRRNRFSDNLQVLSRDWYRLVESSKLLNNHISAVCQLALQKELKFEVIMNLPDEILSKILYWSIDSLAYSELVLKRVCKRWRKMVKADKVVVNSLYVARQFINSATAGGLQEPWKSFKRLRNSKTLLYCPYSRNGPWKSLIAPFHI